MVYAGAGGVSRTGARIELYEVQCQPCSHQRIRSSRCTESAVAAVAPLTFRFRVSVARALYEKGRMAPGPGSWWLLGNGSSAPASQRSSHRPFHDVRLFAHSRCFAQACKKQ